MQNIHVKRYNHPQSVGYSGTIEPEDGSWILFVPADGGTPELHVEVEYATNEEDDNPQAFEDGNVKTSKGYTPAIFLDDRVTVKDDFLAELGVSSQK